MFQTKHCFVRYFFKDVTAPHYLFAEVAKSGKAIACRAIIWGFKSLPPLIFFHNKRWYLMKKIIALILVIFLIGCQPAAQPAAAPQAQPATPAVQTPPATPAPVAPEITPGPVQEPTGPAQSPYEVMQEVSTSSGTVAPGPTTATDPVVLKQGYFQKVVHPTNGLAQIIMAPGGILSLNLRGFDTMPGPGLTLVLHTGDPATGFVVGTLVSHTGNYPYNIPKDTDVSKYTKVSVYNKKYNVIYGTADLK